MPAARHMPRTPKPAPPPPLWWEAFAPLSPAERLLRNAARDGEECDLLEFEEAERVIRPAFFRALCLRVAEIDPHGISVTDAIFTESLDLSHVDFAFGLTFTRCEFQASVSFEGATLRYLHFFGGSIGGQFNGNDVKTVIDFYLRPFSASESLTLTGPVSLFGACIGGQFACVGANFNHEGENCLHAQALEAAGSVFLRQATFAGQVDFDATELEGGLFTTEAVFQQGFSLFHAHVGKRFSWYPATEREIEDRITKAKTTIRTAGTIDLRNAQVDTWDDGYAFEQTGNRYRRDFCVEWLGKPQGRRTDDGIAADARKAQYRLEGFVYDRFAKEMPVDAGELSWWLRLADENEYHPQPFERMARVLREMGHESEARQIAIAQRIQRRRYQKRSWKPIRCFFEFWLLDLITRYGYRPWRAVMLAIVICIFAGMGFGNAYQAGAIVPASQDALPEIVQQRDAALATELLKRERQAADRKAQQTAPKAKPPVKPAKRDWTAREKEIAAQVEKMPEEDKPPLKNYVPGGYPYFNTAMYTLDVFLPIVELHQQEYWIPDRDRPGGGQGWFLLWFVCIAGWLLSTLFAVSFTSIVKTE